MGAYAETLESEIRAPQSNMSTILQERLAKETINNLKRAKPFNKKELVVLSGYDETTAIKQVPRVFNQKGVLKALEKYGFTLDIADNQVVKILHKGKEENRLRAADYVSKRLGGYAPEKSINLNVEGAVKQLSDEELEKLAYKEAESKETEALEAP